MRRRPINQQCYGGSSFEAADNFDESEGIITDNQRLDIPSSPRGLAEFGKVCARFRQCDDLQPDTLLRQQWTAEFPIAQVRRQQKNAAFVGLRFLKIFPAAGLAEQIV